MKAVCLDPGFPGAGRVLKELCKVFKDRAAYFDLNDITSRPHGYETLFLPAWHPSYINIIRQVNASKTCVVWTSPVLQTEFAPVELEYLEVIKSLMQQGLITHLWLGSPDWTSIINVKKGSVFHCSYPITMPKTTVKRNRGIPPQDVSLFGPLSPRKNIVSQALAAKLADCTIHITDASTAPLIENLGCRLKVHGWLPEEEYGQLVESMDLGLQVSIPGVESFSYVAWDHISRGIPCLTTVEWAPKDLQVTYYSDPGILVMRMGRQMMDKDYYLGFADRYSDKVNANVKSTLEKQGLL